MALLACWYKAVEARQKKEQAQRKNMSYSAHAVIRVLTMGG